VSAREDALWDELQEVRRLLRVPVGVGTVDFICGMNAQLGRCLDTLAESDRFLDRIERTLSSKRRVR